MTYGELVEHAAGSLVGLHALADVPFRNRADAASTSTAWSALLATGIRHAKLLAPTDELVAALPALRPAPLAGGEAPGPDTHPAGDALARSARSLGLAHDVLASHFGPDREPRTRDALLVDGAGPHSRAMREVSAILLTAAVAHPCLAHRMLDVDPDPGGWRRIPPAVDRVLRAGFAVLGPAVALHDRVRSATPTVPDRLGEVTVATALAGPDRPLFPVGDLTDQLGGALLRLAVAAHRQGRGEVEVGAATMRALSAVAITMLRHDLEHLQRTGRPRRREAALVSAGRSWTALHRAWSELRTLDTGGRSVLHDASIALRLLDSQPLGAGIPAEAIAAASAWVPDLAVSLVAANAQLITHSPVLVPTRWLEGADVPRRWSAAYPVHLGRIAGLHQDVARHSAPLAQATPWSSATAVHRVPTHEPVASLSRSS